jgi:hypothetical protein
MMQRIHERVKIDNGLIGQTINNTNASGPFYKASDFRRAIGVLMCGALAVTKTCKLELMEATDAAGTSATLLTGATATITANVSVSELTIALDTVLNGEAVTINGLVFTGHTNTTTAASRQFSIAGDNTADAAALAGLINDSVYGVSGVTATAATGTITLKATDPGKTLITATSAAATYTIATTKALAFVEFDGLELSAGFTHIGCKITSTGNGGVAAVLLRTEERDVIEQKVAASAAA